MTVLADHASPYMARTLPKRGPLAWQSKGIHYLLSDAQGAPDLQRFLSTAQGQTIRNLGAISPEEARAPLQGLLPDDHVLAVGAEVFLQRIHALVWDLGLLLTQLHCQRVGPDLRDILCMHCRAICHLVGARIHRCGCGTTLLVRDHFSARLGLYQGAPLPFDDPLVSTLRGQPLSLSQPR